MLKHQFHSMAAIAMAAALGLSACSKSSVRRDKPGDIPTADADAGMTADQPFDPKTVVGTEWREVPHLKAATFAVDQSTLSSEARRVLQANATLLKEHPDMEVRVSGHCDERGTVEYNVALGERRARAARLYYRDLGVANNRLSTVSFGEERSVCDDPSEECWARNRRVETRVRIVPTKNSRTSRP